VCDFLKITGRKARENAYDSLPTAFTGRKIRGIEYSSITRRAAADAIGARNAQWSLLHGSCPKVATLSDFGDVYRQISPSKLLAHADGPRDAVHRVQLPIAMCTGWTPSVIDG